VNHFISFVEEVGFYLYINLALLAFSPNFEAKFKSINEMDSI